MTRFLRLAAFSLLASSPLLVVEGRGNNQNGGKTGKTGKSSDPGCSCTGLVTYKYYTVSELYPDDVFPRPPGITFEDAVTLSPPSCILSPVASEYELVRLTQIPDSESGWVGIYKDDQTIINDLAEGAPTVEQRQGFMGLDGSSVFEDAWAGGEPNEVNPRGEVAILDLGSLQDVPVDEMQPGAFYKCCLQTQCFGENELTDSQKQFLSRGEAKEFYSFRTGDLDYGLPTQSIERRLEIIQAVQGNPDQSYVEEFGFLDATQRKALRDYSDMLYHKHAEEKGFISNKGINITEDFRAAISTEELIQLVGLEAVQKIHRSFQAFEGYPVTWMALRTTTLRGEKCIQYHQDKENSVLHLWLNEDSDAVTGGNLIYLNRNGTALVETVPGAGVFHGSRLVHGVTPVVGKRYILVLGGHSKDEDDKMKAAIDLKLGAMAAPSGISGEL